MKNNIGCLGYIGYEILPSYVGIMSQTMKFQDPVIKQPVWLMESGRVAATLEAS